MAIEILPIGLKDIEQLSNISKKTFLASHGHSASSEDIEDYINKSFNTTRLQDELQAKQNHFYFIKIDDQLAGYSKIIMNMSYKSISLEPLAKFERLYLLVEFYGCGLGQKLFDHTLEIARSNGQKGLWLFVWIENERAINFYQKNHFRIVDQQDFKISENHANPNHVMWRKL